MYYHDVRADWIGEEPYDVRVREAAGDSVPGAEGYFGGR